jgi:hypothetical protein
VKQSDGGESKFTPIWVFSLTEPDQADLKVYQEFSLVPVDANDTSTDYKGPWMPIEPPAGGYGKATFPPSDSSNAPTSSI